MSPTKPPEELYDTQSDPHEVHNLAHSPEHREILRRMRGALRDWMIETRDTGLLPEAEMALRSAGRSPYEMARRGDKFPVARILDAAELVGKGAEEIPKLVALLGDRDSAVRYWAATGLLALGPQARDAEAPLAKALTDAAPNVRLAAAEALCRLGSAEDALPVLVEGLQSRDERVRLQAASTLAALGEKARPAITPIRAALARKGRGNFALYTRWALEYALKNLQR